MSLKDFISKISGNTAATNEAYLQYEKVAGKQILERNSSGGFITQNNGYYELNDDGREIQTTKIDAFRHTYTSAKVSRDMGEGTAHLLGDLWEMTGQIGSDKESSNATKMDTWNNSQGRAIQKDLGNNATNDQLATAIYQAMENRNLITDSTDSRQYSGGSWLGKDYSWENDYKFDIGLEASMIWTKADWASGQINNFSYNNYGNSSNLTIPNCRLSVSSPHQHSAIF